MNYDMAMINSLQARAQRRESRREFFKTAGGAAVAVAGGTVGLGVSRMAGLARVAVGAGGGAAGAQAAVNPSTAATTPARK